MFEVGADYRIFTLETGENYDGKHGTYETSLVYELAAVEGTLLKLLGPDHSDPKYADFLPEGIKGGPRTETIVNTAGLFFVRAEKIVE